MINLKEFLKSHTNSFYALVSYNRIIEPTYFCYFTFDNDPWFLESPCELQFYDGKAVVENFQVAPYLHKYEIEDIKVVSEKEVLKYLLKERMVIKK